MVPPFFDVLFVFLYILCTLFYDLLFNFLGFSGTLRFDNLLSSLDFLCDYISLSLTSRCSVFHIFCFYTVLRILSYPYIFLTVIFLFSGSSWYFLFSASSLSTASLTIASSQWTYNGTSLNDSAGYIQVAFESTESADKHHKNLILYNFPMGAIYQILEYLVYQNW